jgi:hypothetical protein
MTLAALLLLADLEIVSVISAKPALTTDETFSVAVKIHNRGPEEAKDVKVTIGANALSYFKSISAPKGWTCEKGQQFGYALACTVPSLASDAEVELTATLASAQHQAMTYRVGGRVQSATKDENDTNDRKQQSLAIEATKDNAELSLTAATEADHVNVEVRNAGPNDAREVMVVLSEAVNASGRGWKCEGAVCTRPLLKKGTSATLQVDAQAIAARVRAEKNRESARDNAVKLP